MSSVRNEIETMTKISEALFTAAAEGNVEIFVKYLPLPNFSQYMDTSNVVDKVTINKAFDIAASHGQMKVINYLFDYFDSHYDRNDMNDYWKNERAARLGVRGGHFEFAKKLVMRNENDSELKVHICSDGSHFCERRPLIEEMVAKTMDHMRFIENLINLAPVFNTGPLYKFFAYEVNKTGYLKDEKHILYVINQFEHEKSRKSFLEKAKPLIPFELDIKHLLFMAHQMQLLKQQPNFDFNQAFQNAMQQEVILKDVKKYAHSISMFRHPSQRKKANELYATYKQASVENGLNGLMGIIDGVKSDEVFPAISKYKSR